MNEASNLRTLRLAVLLSGTGRTLENLLRWRQRGELLAEIVAVASNRDNVRGLDIAREACIAHQSFRLSLFEDRVARDAAMLDWVRSHGPDLIVLAGYLALLDLDHAGGVPVINIHPALLPRYGGEGYFGDKVHAAVLEAGDAESGCTIHMVDAEFDRGRILAQRRVPVRAADTVQSLARRVFEAECLLYPETINAIARGEVALGG